MGANSSIVRPGPASLAIVRIRARQTRKTDRELARQAHDKARERYEGLTKADLSDQLAARDLPKTGNVDDLIERLIEADSK